MGRNAGIILSRPQRRALKKFMEKTKDKREYRAAWGILLRAEGEAVADIARRLGVTMKQVFVWTRKFRAEGTNRLKVRKQTGRPATKALRATPIISDLLDADPQAFGYLKGRWVLRDIARQLKKEGIHIHYTSVRRILEDLDIKLKSPKLRAPGSIKKNYKKRVEIGNYKKVAAALLKKTSFSHFKTRNGQNFSQK